MKSIGRLLEQLDVLKGKKRSVQGYVSVVEDVPDEGVDWHVVEQPRRLRRIFVIEDKDARSSFIIAMIDYFSFVRSYPKILIDGKKVVVDVYTPGIDDVTQADRSAALRVDEIFVDSMSSVIKSELSFERYG